MTDAPFDIVVSRTGRSRHLVDAPAELTDELGEVSRVWRNSHVEPGENLGEPARRWLAEQQLPLQPHMWYADMTPVGGPVLGPFPLARRDEALQAEIDWLHDQQLPLPVHEQQDE